MKKNLLVLTFLLLTACSSTPPAGNVVSETSVGTFHAKYPGQNLKIGDRVRIFRMKSIAQGEFTPPPEKKIIGEGRVSSILHDNFYEIKSETAQHIPTDAFIEKL
jgi:hypothetical protein